MPIRNKKLNFKPKNGFTLIELLVVIVIIGLLSSILFIAFNSVRQKARQAKVKADLKQVVIQIELVRDSKNDILQSITGSNFTAGNGSINSVPAQCVDPNGGTWFFKNLKGIGPGDLCYDWLNLQFQKLGFTKVPVDPWGSPYLIDENEGQDFCSPDSLCPCRNHDLVYSAGPDGYGQNGSLSHDDVIYRLPFFSCSESQAADGPAGFAN